MKRPRNENLKALRVEPRSAWPLYRQIYEQLRQAILEQEVSAGTRLPSTRSLSRTLGISRNTVLAAYEALIQDGLLSAHHGSGTRVNALPERLQPIATPIRPTFDLWAALREARFPASAVRLRDPDGNPVHIHR